jgi:hypothetical protein
MILNPANVSPLFNGMRGWYPAEGGRWRKNCTVAETFAEVPNGRHTAHTLRQLAHWLDPS